jgi:aminoglycoside 3'-phosphotransferase-2
MSELSSVPHAGALPPEWRIRLLPYHFERDEVGRSSAGVFKLVSDGEASLFLKVEPAGPFAELPDEATRLRWLAGAGIACPNVIAQDVHDGQNWLLISAVPGRDLSAASITPQQCTEILATALRLLHAVDIRTCPFDHGLSSRMALARARMEAGEVDEDDFDDARLGQTADDIFRLLEIQKPEGADLVVTHGDACLPNLLADDGRFSGFVDCARLGVADRYQDLALAYRSVCGNFGEEWGRTLLDLYGVAKPDRAKLDYYQLLDEFF